MAITLQNWRQKLLAKAGDRLRWRLMAYSNYDYYGGPQYTDAADCNWCVYANEWFIAPATLVDAHKTAVATVQFLEANLEAYYQKSRHYKYGVPF